jgi:serine/threonine-protein kinase
MSALPPTTAERDERLAGLLSELTEERRRGGRPDVDGMAARHPDLAAELRALWAAAQFADEFTRPSSRPRLTPCQVGAAALPADGTPRVFGDFELLGELGRGGMGVVYKARQVSLNRLVALKMVLRGDLATPADLARFEAEARAAAHLDHPNVVPVYGAGEHDGQAFFSMRYVEGETLAAVLARGPLRPLDAARLLAVIARAVEYAHRRGVLHRDLKPSNVLLDGAGEPHVTDFGLAKRVAGGAALTQTGDVLGTPAYMAPEQVSGRRGSPGPASDVYSLGVILYETLTGRPPFQAASRWDTMQMVLEQDPVRPRLLNPQVGPDLELVCLKCLQKDPALRYASAADLAADLEAFQSGGTLSVRSFSVGDFFVRAMRETPNAVVLENWGVLWMCHSAMVFSQCVLTTGMAWRGVTNPLWYLLLWGGGLAVWGVFFWKMRQRAGPVLFVERQVAHVWASAVAATVLVFVVEWLLKLPVLRLAPMLAVIAGMVFVAKAGMLSGTFYLYAAAEYVTALPMCLWPDYGILMFGAVTAVCFFVPGLKYHRQRLRARRGRPPLTAAAR